MTNNSGVCAPSFDIEFSNELDHFVRFSLNSLVKYSAGSQEFTFFLKVLEECNSTAYAMNLFKQGK